MLSERGRAPEVPGSRAADSPPRPVLARPRSGLHKAPTLIAAGRGRPSMRPPARLDRITAAIPRSAATTPRGGRSQAALLTCVKLHTHLREALQVLRSSPIDLRHWSDAVGGPRPDRATLLTLPRAIDSTAAQTARCVEVWSTPADTCIVALPTSSRSDCRSSASRTSMPRTADASTIGACIRSDQSRRARLKPSHPSRGSRAELTTAPRPSSASPSPAAMSCRASDGRLGSGPWPSSHEEFH